MPHRSLTIEFNHSSSPAFGLALIEARKNPTFAQSGKSYSLTYNNDPDPLHLLINRLKSFRNKRIYVDDQEYPWDEVFSYLPCYALRSRAYDPKQHCHGDSRQFPAFNPWHCIQTLMPLSNNTEWLHDGRFDRDGTWIFDKERIKHRLLANTYAFRFCPALDIEATLRVLNAFPETANPQIDPDWQYDEPLNRSLIIGIKIGSEIKYACGVKPSSPFTVKNIYKKILNSI